MARKNTIAKSAAEDKAGLQILVPLIKDGTDIKKVMEVRIVKAFKDGKEAVPHKSVVPLVKGGTEVKKVIEVRVVKPFKDGKEAVPHKSLVPLGKGGTEVKRVMDARVVTAYFNDGRQAVPDLRYVDAKGDKYDHQPGYSEGDVFLLTEDEVAFR